MSHIFSTERKTVIGRPFQILEAAYFIQLIYTNRFHLEWGPEQKDSRGLCCSASDSPSCTMIPYRPSVIKAISDGKRYCVVLMGMPEGRESQHWPQAFCSQAMPPAVGNYALFEKQLLGLVGFEWDSNCVSRTEGSGKIHKIMRSDRPSNNPIRWKWYLEKDRAQGHK